MTRRMVVESDLASLSVPLQFLSFSDAYLDSASRLCTVLKRSHGKSNYARGSVVLYLTFHSIELFLKGAILERNPKEKLINHDIQVLSNRYNNLYQGKKFELHAPFISRDKVNLSDLYSPEDVEEVESYIKEIEWMNPLDQRHRYPRNLEGQPWDGLVGFEPESFLVEIKKLKKDIALLAYLIFPANTVLRGTRGWYKQAAAQGDPRAQYNLGVLYSMGNGVPQDYAKARQLWEQAAIQGNELAQNSLGSLYYTGRGVPQDDAMARQWFEQAAAQGDAGAQFNLGRLYTDGRGVPQDDAKARGWYKQAAAQDHADAQYNLGVMYAEGQDVPQDSAQAREWFEKAAAQGHAMAQVNLGILYARGYGVPKDDVQAYMWLSLAAAYLTGDDQKLATDNRDIVAHRMTPAKIAAAQRLTQQCQTQQFKGG